MKNHNLYYLGIDAGGSTCTVAISGLEGKILKSVDYPACHLTQNNIENFCALIYKYIVAFTSSYNYNLKNISGICVAAAGLRKNSDKKLVAKRFGTLLKFKKIIAESDSVVALCSKFYENDGCILISGTGSVLLSRINKKIIRAGGWGYLIDDRGSGYSIGKKALQYLVNEYDSGKRKSRFCSIIEQIAKINSDSLISRIYKSNFKIQSLAITVIKLADKKNPVAVNILKEAADELLELFELFINKTRLKNKIKLTFAGSVIQNDNYYSRLLKKKLKSKYSDFFKIIKNNNKPVQGSIYLAIKQFNKLK